MERYRPCDVAFTAVIVVVCLLGAAAIVQAQPGAVPESLNWMVPEIQQCQATVDGIRWHAHVALGLALTVGLLGIAISAMQAWSAPAGKTIVVVLGLAVSGLTLISDQIYQGVTHHTLYARCDAGKRLVSSMWRELRRASDVGEASQGLAGLRQVIEEHLGKCDALSSNGMEQASLPRFASIAFAGVVDNLKEGPNWISGKESTEHAIYFVGVAHGRDGSVGREEALVDARNAIRRYLESGLAESSAESRTVARDAANRLASGAGVIDTYSTYDPASGFVSSYALLALDRRQLRRALLAAVEGGSGGEAGTVDQTVNQIAGPSPEYESRRQRAYACILDQGRQSMSPEAYQRFVAVREDRKRADQSTRSYSDTLASMRALSDENPDCYLCWYNLAILYTRTKDAENAIVAYRKAIALEPALGCHDASIYATFGRLLIDEHRYDEAVSVLQTAASYDDQHPYVPQLLVAATEALAQPEAAAVPGAEPPVEGE